MKPQIFVELTTRAFCSTDRWMTFRKELGIDFPILPTKIRLLLLGEYHFFVVDSASYVCSESEKDSEEPIIIKLHRREYPSAFIKRLVEDPEWTRKEEKK